MSKKAALVVTVESDSPASFLGYVLRDTAESLGMVEGSCLVSSQGDAGFAFFENDLGETVCLMKKAHGNEVKVIRDRDRRGAARWHRKVMASGFRYGWMVTTGGEA